MRLESFARVSQIKQTGICLPSMGACPATIPERNRIPQEKSPKSALEVQTYQQKKLRVDSTDLGAVHTWAMAAMRRKKRCSAMTLVPRKPRFYHPCPDRILKQ